MIIYIDLVIFINFIFDMLLLIVVNITLKRNVKLWRIFLGGIVGGISILFLFIKINSLELFLIKILISILMLLITFGYNSIRYFMHNFFYLYLSSMILGGFLYFLNIQFSYKNTGLVFFHNGWSINIIFLLIISPFILYIYIRSNKRLRNTYSNYYKVKIKFKNNRILDVTAFLDTGNHLSDPYFKRPIILVSKNSLKNKIKIENPLLVPYYSLNNKNLLPCIKINSLMIDGKKTRNVLLGISNEKFGLDGIGCILNPKVLEELK